MCLFSSLDWTRCWKVFRMALVVSVMLASPLVAQAQGKAPWVFASPWPIRPNRGAHCAERR
jgi:hypothetical protein